MVITRQPRSVGLLAAVMLAALPLLVPVPVGAAPPPPVGIPLAPGADFLLLSKTTTTDPFQIQTEGPTKLQFSQISVAPHGTTGLDAGGGIVVATVTEGVATALSSETGDCASRAVETGAAVIRPAGSVGEIRNDTGDPLELVVVTMTPSGRVAALPAGPCPATQAKGVTAKVLNESVIEAPLDTESKGTSDIWVVLVRVAPGATTGWHVQQRPYLLGVNEGDITLKVGSDGGCDVTTYSPNQGFFEAPLSNHEDRNGTSRKASYYGIGFVPNPEPPIAPSTAPKSCGSQS